MRVEYRHQCYTVYVGDSVWICVNSGLLDGLIELMSRQESDPHAAASANDARHRVARQNETLHAQLADARAKLAAVGRLVNCEHGNIQVGDDELERCQDCGSAVRWTPDILDVTESLKLLGRIRAALAATGREESRV
jgi:hypothetical protein